MKRLFKYELQERGIAIVEMPAGAKLLHVADQCGAAQLWAEVDDQRKLEARRIAVLYTGFDGVPEGAVYVGTAISNGGNIVRHVYEVPSPAGAPAQ